MEYQRSTDDVAVDDVRTSSVFLPFLNPGKSTRTRIRRKEFLCLPKDLGWVEVSANQYSVFSDVTLY